MHCWIAPTPAPAPGPQANQTSMELLKRQEGYDRTQIVHQYLEANTHHDNPPDEKSTVARLCAESQGLFRAVIKEFLKRNGDSNPSKQYVSLERSFSRLKLWSDGYGVSQGELDNVFAKSRTVRHATSKLLASIGATLTDRKSTPSPER